MNRNKGFTLIEVLLALFITAILITILSVVFNTGLRSYRQGKDLIEITRKGQIILGQMTKEVSGAMVQDGYISFEGGSNSIYFMAPVDNDSEKGVDLCEIGYRHEEDVLKRHFITADKGDYQYPVSPVKYLGENEEEFCKNVKSIELHYYDGKETKWEDSWNSTKELPQMVEITIDICGGYPKNEPKQEKIFTTWIYLPNSTNNP